MICKNSIEFFQRKDIHCLIAENPADNKYFYTELVPEGDFLWMGVSIPVITIPCYRESAIVSQMICDGLITLLFSGVQLVAADSPYHMCRHRLCPCYALYIKVSPGSI